MTREQRKEEQIKRGQELKGQIKALADRLDKKGRTKLKLALQMRDVSETVARELLNGVYDSNPGRDLIDSMEEALASFGKAKASA